jgi:hypothetical protein
MPSRWDLPDALSENSASPDDVRYFVLVPVDLHCARPYKICRRVQIEKLCFHVVLS